ncbi:MAG: hypothetical protein WD876_01700, partial [Candidatus Pacearchaeota archaeon]
VNQSLCKEAKKHGIKIVSPKELLFKKVDILSPCALGGIINKKTISKLNCKIIAGGANNQLENETQDEKRLLKRKIIFIPDFVLNVAGFMQALIEREGGTVEEARRKSKIVGEKISLIINHSQKHRKTLLESAIELFG